MHAKTDKRPLEVLSEKPQAVKLNLQKSKPSSVDHIGSPKRISSPAESDV